MEFLEAVFNESLTIKSGNETLDKIFDYYLEEFYSPMMVSKIHRVFKKPLKFKDFKAKNNIMCYTQGLDIYINRPLFENTPKEKAMNYILHEMVHLLINTHKFPELQSVVENLYRIVLQAVPRGKESVFFTGKKQDLHSDWKGETLSYLCNNVIKWDVAISGTKLAYQSTLIDSGLFNMNSKWWKKRFK